ncbi:MAG: hypothetical protein RDU76_05380 [Candidatus Edwardsbacteria bacterium]|nr:hypothetical protein [Candidatus Edwardsbacteria bacterium]
MGRYLLLFGLSTFATVAFTQPVTTLRNAELFSRQYAQTDTAIDSQISPSKMFNSENPAHRKSQPKKSSIFKTTLSSALCSGGGFLAGLGIGWCLLGDPIGAVIVGGGSGAIFGCSMGTYIIGRKYRKGSYWHALAGTVLPVLTVAGPTVLFSNSSRFNENPTLITFAFAPITSTAAYYIFSEELPDTAKTP